LGTDYAGRTGFVSSLLAAGGMLAGSGATCEYVPADGAVVVLCGSDADYADKAATAARALKAKGARHLYLAGRPGELEADLRSAGVDGFLYMGGDAVAELGELLAAASKGAAE
ncbi:MAG: hypothetical protein WA840_16635, partial [Caulobacteraceae bacterium]